MSVFTYCPTCGDVIGVKEATLESPTCITPSSNAPCKGTHGKPIRRTVRKKFFGLISVERTQYPNGSFSTWEEYVGKKKGWQLWVLRFYVTVLRHDVCIDYRWLFAGNRIPTFQ